MSSSLTNHARSFLPNALGVAGRDMDDLFDRLFQTDSNRQSHRLSAPISIWEEGENYFVSVELPGIPQEAIDVTFDKGTLKVSATREAPSNEHRKFLHDERSYGELTRTVNVPKGVDPESIDAEFANGMLTIKLTKRPEEMPKKIEVRSA